MIVDDNRDAASTLALLLRVKGHDVHVANSGADALEAAPTFRPEMVALDLGMPGMNGIDTAKAIRQTPWGQKVTLIAVTGWGQENDRALTKDAGFDHHLVKPIDFASIQELLCDGQSSSP